MQIWLAEDEAPQREHLAALLRQVCAARGVACELRAFEDGQALVDAYAPGVDLLLLDIDMPGLSGMDAAHRIRERDERVLIVFVPIWSPARWTDMPSPRWISGQADHGKSAG